MNRTESAINKKYNGVYNTLTDLWEQKAGAKTPQSAQVIQAMRPYLAQLTNQTVDRELTEEEMDLAKYFNSVLANPNRFDKIVNDILTEMPDLTPEEILAFMASDRTR